jgi:hypothetical protein
MLQTISETKATRMFADYTITTIFPDYNTYYFHRASTPFPLKKSFTTHVNLSNIHH